MSTPANKAEMIETLRHERDRWEALLAQVGRERMEQPGIEGDWSVKDVIAHVTAYEQRDVQIVEAIAHHQPLPPPRWPNGMIIDNRNALMHKQDQHLSPDATLAQSQQTFDKLLEALQLLSDEQLMDSHSYAWTGGEPLWQSLIGNSYEHYHEHHPALRAWLDKQTRT